MQRQHTLTHHFYIFAAALCCFYLGFEFIFDSYTRLGVDEFWFGNNIYLYKDKLPYRDFSPYKSVLGYYLLLPAMLSNYGTIFTLVFTKNVMAFLNAAALFATSCWLTRFFSRPAVLLSLLMLICSETFLSYSSNIRVDLPSYWFCFFSILLLLEKRFTLAGMLLGLGFITSQKALWYIVAVNGAFGINWLIYSRELKCVRDILRLNLTMLLVICSYLLFWSSIADTHTVINNVFFEASAMYHLDWYDDARYQFWKMIITFNPLLFLLWPLTLLSLVVSYQEDHAYQQRLTLIIAACTILFCLMPYKQVFPYYMQTTYPIFLGIYAAFFSWLFGLLSSQQEPIMIGGQTHWLVLGGYLAGVIGLYIFFDYPTIYLLIITIPVLLGYFLIYSTAQRRLNNIEILKLILTTCAVLGFLLQSIIMSRLLYGMDGEYQKANLQMMDALLQDGSDYVAGTDYIYNKKQPIAGLRHLMGPAIDYLKQPTPKLRAVMLASLYEDPTVTKDSVIRQLKQSSVKFFVNSYRIMLLPTQIKAYLDAEYQHYWGSIYLYSPSIAKGRQHVTLRFSGQYRIESPVATIALNHHLYHANEVVYLAKGIYESRSQHNYRLRLVPQHFKPADSMRDQWEIMVL